MADVPAWANEAAGVPVAAPSANLSMQLSPTRPEHVLRGLGGRIDLILDGGACAVGLESTIVDLSRGVPVILRPGAIGADDIAVPPFATRLLVEPSSASGTVEVTLSDAASALAFYTDATMPSAGIELAGATQVQVVVGTAPARLTWILEM